MSQGKTSQNIPIQTDFLYDSELGERETLLQIAANPQTPSDWLRNLSSSSDRLIRKTVVGNPNTPRDILFKLGAEFPNDLINNPVWNLLFLEDPTALGNLPLIVQHHILLQDEVPSYFMEVIAAGGNTNLCLRLTRHPKTPLSILQKIVNNSQTWVEEAVKLHINWPEPLKDSVEEMITAILEKRSSTTSTEKALFSLAKSGLLFDLLGLDFQENYNEIDEIFYQNLWVKSLKQLKTKELDTIEPFNNKPNETIEEILSELSQDPDPTIQTIFSGNFPPCTLLFEALFPEEYYDDTPSTLEDGELDVNEVPQKQRVTRAIGEKFSQIWANLISNPRTPSWLLYTLASLNLSLGRQIVKQPHIPAFLLEKLAQSEDVLVQREVAQHPNTPKSALQLLALFPDIEVRCSVARHRNTRLFERLILAVDEAVGVRREIAQHPQTPMIALELLAMDQDVWTRLEVAKHPNTPVTSLANLTLDENFYVRTTAISNRNTPGDILLNLILCKTLPVQMRSTNQSNLLQLLSAKLKVHREYRIGQGIVRSDYLPYFRFKQGKITTNLEIVNFALNNPNASATMLKRLLCDRYLYAADSGETYRIVASHYLHHKPKSLPLVLKKLVEYSTDSFERLVALLHPQVPPSALAQNLWSLDWLERYCVAQHPNTPIYTLKKLATDGNRVVRTVAENRLKQFESAASTESS